MEKPKVRICAGCQQEFPAVNAQVKAHAGDIMFSHGSCPRHGLEFYKGAPNVTPQQLAIWKAQLDADPNKTPDLAEHPDLLKAYSQGIFTPEQNLAALKERLQKLANIVKG